MKCQHNCKPFDVRLEHQSPCCQVANGIEAVELLYSALKIKCKKNMSVSYKYTLITYSVDMSYLRGKLSL